MRYLIAYIAGFVLVTKINRIVKNINARCVLIKIYKNNKKI